MNKFLQKFAEISALGYGLGLAPKAPGTFGSLGGLACGWITFHIGAILTGSAAGLPFYAVVSLSLVALCLFAFWSIHYAEKAWGTHDEGRIVMDEFAGQAIAVAFFAPTITNYIIGFILFRIFDIWKPGLIGIADEKLPGAWGTLVDDLIAGVVAAALLGLMINWPA